MIPDPLHPAIVHFPVVLAVLLPIAAFVAWAVIHRGAAARKVWLPVVLLAFLTAGSAWAAVETGENEEETVEAVVPEQALHAHEEAAELLLPLTFVILVIAGVGLMGGRIGAVARGAAAIGSVLMLAAALRVGHSGGELVYVHGAASAYTLDGQSPGPAERHDDEDEPRR